MGGCAVWARYGARDGYAPLVSPLCPDSDPVSLAGRFQSDYGAQMLYIADIDAIMGRGNNAHLIQAIKATHPSLELWVDAGLGDQERLARFQRQCAGRPVIGSETLSDPRLLGSHTSAVLSLDFRGGQLLGPTGFLDQIAPDLHSRPRDLIVMSMHRVGGNLGPDLELLDKLTPRFPGCSLFAAGGVRDATDLKQLQSAGATGVLLASALHEGRIGADDTAIDTRHC